MQGTVPRVAAFTQALCADEQGFSLHAALRCCADERQRLEQLCRYITRPALANERVQCNAAGQVVLKLKTAWRDGTTHIVMSPLQFMQRLATLVPRPGLHLIHLGVRITSLCEVSGPPLRDHGVLAPSLPRFGQAADAGGAGTAAGGHRRVGARRDRVRLRAWPAGAHQLGPRQGLPALAPVIERILTHLGLQADWGRMTAPARGHTPQEGLAPASASAARRVVRRCGHRRASASWRKPPDRGSTIPVPSAQHTKAEGVRCAPVAPGAI